MATDYDQKWDTLMKYGVINADDEFTTPEEFVDIITSAERDPLGKISSEFAAKLAGTGSFEEFVEETKERIKEEIAEELPGFFPRRKTTIAEREDILDSFVSGESQAGIARRLGRPSGTIRSIITRARQQGEL